MYIQPRVSVVWNLTSKEVEMNPVLKQGCSVSPSLVNIYVYYLEFYNVMRNLNKTPNTITYNNDQMIISDSENSLPEFSRVDENHNSTISQSKTKILMFTESQPASSKIVIDSDRSMMMIGGSRQCNSQCCPGNKVCSSCKQQMGKKTDIDNRGVEQVKQFTFLCCRLSYVINQTGSIK